MKISGGMRLCDVCMCVLPSALTGEVCVRCTVNGETHEKRQERMTAAFAKVKPDNWKDPIRATITATDGELLIIEDAVIYFTGSIPTFRRHKNGRVTVMAAGYYRTIGA